MKRVSLLILFIILLTSCSKIQYKNYEELKEFNFEFSFGVESKNTLNTFEGIFVKDLISSSTTTKLELTKNEMKEIYNKMKIINLLDYPDINNFDEPAKQIPYDSYKLRVKIDNQVKEIKWDDKDRLNSNQAIILRDLFNKIKEIIYNKEEYKKLPNAIGGYS